VAYDCNKKWSDSHSKRVLKSLEDNLFTAIGKRNIAELKTRDLLAPIKVVEAIRATGSCFTTTATDDRDNALRRAEWVN
jgi:hypothetical protein